MAQPLQPRYKSTFDDTIAVANQERILQRTPRHVTLKGNVKAETQQISRQPSAVPTSQSDYVVLREKDVNKSGFVVSAGGEILSKPNPVEKPLESEEYILKDVSEYVLQNNGMYKLKDSGHYLIPSHSALLQGETFSDHPFAPSSSDTSTTRMSLSSDEFLQHRNSRHIQSDGFQSSSSDGSYYSGPRYIAAKGDTGITLTRVKNALEATPPQFLVVPQKESISRSTSPTPTVRSSVGTNTFRAPPNTGHGKRIEERLKRRHSKENGENNDKTSGTDKPRLFHHHSSPELFRTKTKSLFSNDPSRDTSPIAGRNGRTGRNRFLHPNRDHHHSSSAISSPNRKGKLIDENYLSPLTGAYKTYSSEDGHEGDDDNSSPERPPHLTPSPVPSAKPRQKSAISTLSISPSIKSSSPSISRSAHQSPLKINAHGLVFI